MGEFEPKNIKRGIAPDDEPTEDLETTEELEETEGDLDELALESMDDTEYEETEVRNGLVQFFTENDDTYIMGVINEGDEKILQFILSDENYFTEVAAAINKKWKDEMKSFGDKIKIANSRLHFIENQSAETLIATGEIENAKKFQMLRRAVQLTVHALVKVSRPTLDKSADPEDEFFT